MANQSKIVDGVSVSKPDSGGIMKVTFEVLSKINKVEKVELLMNHYDAKLLIAKLENRIL